MENWELELYKVYISDDPGLTLTYFTARSIWYPMHLYVENFNGINHHRCICVSFGEIKFDQQAEKFKYPLYTTVLMKPDLHLMNIYGAYQSIECTTAYKMECTHLLSDNLANTLIMNCLLQKAKGF